MNPAAEKAAGHQASEIIRIRLRHVSSETRRRRVEKARIIAATIWRRWKVGVYRWQLKHVRWFLVHELSGRSANTSYQYFLVIRALIELTDRDRWLASLRGSWSTPQARKPTAIRQLVQADTHS